jgi:hypothetical protein
VSPLGLLRGLASSWFLGKAVAVVLLVAGGWALGEGAGVRQLQVGQVAIYGNELVPSEEILASLGLERTNIFLVRTPRLERSLAAHPALAKVRVQLRLPDLVLVAVSERVPVAVWDTGARRLLADGEGRAFRDVSPDPRWASLPALYAPEGPFPGLGEESSPDAVRAAQTLAPRLDLMGMSGARLEFRPSSGVVVVPRGSPRMMLGFGDDLDGKLAAYQAIRRELDRTRTSAELIDVRFLERPYYR